VEWQGLEVLVFLGATRDFPDVGVYGVREIFLTEISDLDPSWKLNAQPQYLSWTDAFWFSMPRGSLDVLINASYAVAGAVKSVAVDTAGAIGEIVAGILNPVVQPTLKSLAVPLAIAILAFLVLYVPKPK